MDTTLVIVYNDTTRLTELKNLLSKEPLQVVTAGSVAQLFIELESVAPAVILAAHNLPDGPGIDLCRRLKADARMASIPLILLAAPGQKDALAAGADDILTEPFSAAELLARIRPYLELHRLRAQLESRVADYKNLSTRFHNEMAVARNIQRGLLPPPSPDWPGLEVVCFTQPAWEVGGDFYTYYTFDTRLNINEKRYAVAVGDVSGKGMPAALLMAISLASFKNLITQVYSFNKLVTDLVSEAYPLGKFLVDLDEAIAFYTATTRQNCALAYVELTKPTDPDRPVTLRTVNAGCVTPLIRRTDGRVHWVEVGGMPLGAGLGAQFGYQEETLHLSTGDLIILTSDGVIEANNSRGQMLGFERLEQIVTTGPQASAQAMLAHLKTQVAGFVGNTDPHDDMTLVVIQA